MILEHNYSKYSKYRSELRHHVTVIICVKAHLLSSPPHFTEVDTLVDLINEAGR